MGNINWLWLLIGIAIGRFLLPMLLGFLPGTK